MACAIEVSLQATAVVAVQSAIPNLSRRSLGEVGSAIGSLLTDH